MFVERYYERLELISLCSVQAFRVYPISVASFTERLVSLKFILCCASRAYSRI